MATTAELPKNTTPEAYDEAFKAQLHAAGLDDLLPSKIQEWVLQTERAMQEVADLAAENFGAAIKTLSPEEFKASQAALVNAFVEAAVFDKLRKDGGNGDTPVDVQEVIEEFLPKVNIPDSPADLLNQKPVAVKIGTPASMVAKTIKQSVGSTADAAAAPRRTFVAMVDQKAERKAEKAKRPEKKRRWGHRAIGATLLAVGLGGGFAGIEWGKSMNDEMNQRTSHSVSLESSHSDLEISNSFFNGQDPSELQKNDENDFGPTSQAGLEGDRQGMLRDYEALFHGKNSGAYILTDKAAFMQYITGAKIDVQGLAIPTFPGVNALHDKATYDQYEQQVQSTADYLRQHPDAAKQLNDKVMQYLASAQIGELKHTQQTVASNYIDHNSHRLYWDLSVNEGANGAAYRELTISIDGHEGTMIDLEDCGHQSAEINSIPLSTIRPTAETQLVTVQVPTEQTSTPITPETPPTPPTPPMPPTPPTPPSTPLAPKGDEYPTHSNLTNDLGPGDLKPPTPVQTTEQTPTGRQIGTGRVEPSIPDAVTSIPGSISGAQSHDAGVTPPIITLNTSGNERAGTGMQQSATAGKTNTGAVSSR